MRIKRINRVEPGELLGKSIFNERGELMLAAGFKLTDEIIESLVRRGYIYIYIMDEATEDIIPEEVVSEAIKITVNQKLANTFENVRNNLAFEKFAPEVIKDRISEESLRGGLIKMPSIRLMVERVVEEIVENNITFFTSVPVKSMSGYDYEHAFDTTLVAILIGQALKMDYRELNILGAASFIHDIGKIIFPNLRQKPFSQLEKDEKVIIREHPVYSYMILKGSDADSYVEQTAVLQHHERFDGRGFPYGLMGKEDKNRTSADKGVKYIHRYAEILSIANSWDNLLAGSIDGQQLLPDKAMEAMILQAGKSFNPYLIKVLGDVIQKFPTGATVRIKRTSGKLHDGFIGVIRKANPVDQHKPNLVMIEDSIGNKIQPFEIDLKEESYSHIELVT